jgi:CRP-like cAMP-binding protein
MAIFNQPQHRSASVKALSDSELIVIIYYSLEELIKKHPNIVQKIQTFIDERNKQNLSKV